MIRITPSSQAGRLGCRTLIIAKNALVALPPGLGSLATLTSLSCAENRLVELPDDLAVLAATLTHLDARWAYHHQNNHYRHRMVHAIVVGFTTTGLPLPKLGRRTAVLCTNVADAPTLSSYYRAYSRQNKERPGLRSAHPHARRRLGRPHRASTAQARPPPRLCRGLPPGARPHSRLPISRPRASVLRPARSEPG